MLEIIKVALFFIFSMGSLYIIGNFLIQKNGIGKIAIGFLVLLGLCQGSCFSFVAFRKKKIYFILVFAIIYFTLLYCSIKNVIKKKDKFKFIELFRENWISIIVTFVLIVFVLFFYRSDADDSFYVSNATAFQNSEKLNLHDNSMGCPALGTFPTYDFQVWESLIAILSNCFHLEAVRVMHTYLLPILLVISASAYLYLGQILFEDKKKANLFYGLLTIFHLFGGYAVYSEGSFLLSRLWQGKAVYLTVVLPIMIGFVLKSVKEKDNYLWLKLVFCILAGVALNPTSLYVFGFQMFFMLLIIAILNRDINRLYQIIPAVIITAFFFLMLWLRSRQYSGSDGGSTIAGESFVKNTFLSFWGTGRWYFILYLLAVILILKFGSLCAKIYMVYTPLSMFIIVWNPILGKYIAEIVRMVPTYWRTFWLLPVGTSLCYVCIMGVEKCKEAAWKKAIVVAIGILVLAVPGKWMFSQKNNFIKAENIERLPTEVLSFGAKILQGNQQAVVLGCYDFSTTMRQKYVDIELIYSRDMYV